MSRDVNKGENKEHSGSQEELLGKPLRARMRKPGAPPLRNLLPNVLTVLALCAGLTAIRFGLEGRYEFAVYAILVAALLDAFDGRLARMLKAQSSFGAELDSLADFFNFGVAPVLILYTWSLDSLGGLGWVAVLGYSVACALRLARFNVASEDPDRPSWANAFFVGVPAPAAAGLVMLPLYMDFTEVTTFNTWPSLVAVHIGIIAFLMVSRLPTFSGKHLRFSTRRDRALPVLLGVALIAALAVSYPWMTVIGIATLYVSTLPLAYWRHRVLEKRTRIARATRDRDLTV
ncbi:MAG: CDP-alcohol phosphatidyltransferase family protein [Candidatus Phaeomarinobacter sp.]